MSNDRARPVAIVSGTGIGAACARTSATSGCDVPVNYRGSARGAQDTVTACRERGADARAVCPGSSTRTGCPARAHASRSRHSSVVSPLKRLVSADEVAEAVGWFALGGHSITGQLLVIDGGTHLTVGNPLQSDARRIRSP